VIDSSPELLDRIVELRPAPAPARIVCVCGETMLPHEYARGLCARCRSQCSVRVPVGETDALASASPVLRELCRALDGVQRSAPFRAASSAPSEPADARGGADLFLDRIETTS